MAKLFLIHCNVVLVTMWVVLWSSVIRLRHSSFCCLSKRAILSFIHKSWCLLQVFILIHPFPSSASATALPARYSAVWAIATQLYCCLWYSERWPYSKAIVEVYLLGFCTFSATLSIPRSSSMSFDFESSMLPNFYVAFRYSLHKL